MSRPGGSVLGRGDALGMQIKLAFDAIRHGANRSDFSLSDRPVRREIDSLDRFLLRVGVDHVVGRICKERRTFTRSSPLS